MFRSHHITIAVVALILFGGLAAGAPRGSPELSLFLPDNRVAPGDEITLDVFILNGGKVTLGSADSEATARVTTARQVRLLMREGRAPIQVKTAERPVGSVPEGVTGPVQFSVSVDEDASPGAYSVPIRLRYKYTHQISEGTGDSTIHQEKTATTNTHVTIRVDRAARFEIIDADLGAVRDETGEVSVTVQNTGKATARDARLTISAEDDRLTFGGAGSATTFIGPWEPGENRTVSFASELDEGVDNRSFPITIDVTYTDDEGEVQESKTRRTGVTMDGRMDRFVIDQTVNDIAIGESGLIGLTIRNAGPDPVRDARVRIESNDPKLGFGEEAIAETYIGPWPAGESRDIVVKADIDPTADIRPYPIQATVSYREADGERRMTNPLVSGIVPRAEQSFDIRNVESSLAVGEEGQVHGELENTGDQPVRNAVVQFESDNPNVNPIETEFRVGALEPNTRVPFQFDIEISDNAGAGPRQFTVRVRYRDAEGDVRVSDPLDLNITVGPKQDTFAVEPEPAALEPGESRVIALRVTNIDDETLSDISAKLFTSDLLSSSDDEAFITALAPGESTTIRFQVTAARNAVNKTYPVDVDFQYDDADGDTHLSRTYKVPITVSEPPQDDGLVLPVLLGIGILVVLGAGVYYWSRRR